MFTWRYEESPLKGSMGRVRVAFEFSSMQREPSRREALEQLEGGLGEAERRWLVPGKRAWRLNLDEMKVVHEPLKGSDWLKGTIDLEPEVHTSHNVLFEFSSYETTVAFYISQDEIDAASVHQGSEPETSQSLARFRADFPEAAKACFVMMRLADTATHNRIFDAIHSSLAPFGIKALRADHRSFHDELWTNVLTYMRGCAFGIAVFERLESDDFNPNVSLEVGYMLALGKPVCLLKDRTLKTLHSDLVCMLYREFDCQNPDQTISVALTQWCKDKRIIP